MALRARRRSKLLEQARVRITEFGTALAFSASNKSFSTTYNYRGKERIMGLLDGKVAIVTGAGGGLGRNTFA